MIFRRRNREFNANRPSHGLSCATIIIPTENALFRRVFGRGPERGQKTIAPMPAAKGRKPTKTPALPSPFPRPPSFLIPSPPPPPFPLLFTPLTASGQFGRDSICLTSPAHWRIRRESGRFHYSYCRAMSRCRRAARSAGSQAAARITANPMPKQAAKREGCRAKAGAWPKRGSELRFIT